MSLAAGTRLGPYEISALLGRGGMGEVYRARDTKLGRDVALKVLPDLFATQPDRLARFEREAQVLASLNHPNIAAIYGLEESGPVRALVLELVDGPTLADLIVGGSKDPPLQAAQSPAARPHDRRGGSLDPPGSGISIEDALPFARQIAEALAAAHEQGIIHRDLKPANIKVRPDGTVKVLDFGLAKLVESGAGQASGSGGMAALSMSPTLTSPAMTGAGVVLGTAAYMAPEQVKGGAADKRSDLWAFGCVLYEMLTGTRAFRGDDISDTFVSILRDEPEWGRLPSEVPASVRTLLERCLAKDRRKRIADAQVALFLIDEQASVGPSATPVAAPAAGKARWGRMALVAGVAAVAAASATWLATRAEPDAVVRFFVSPPDKTVFTTAGRGATSAAISPDGRMLAFTARDVATSRELLWVRPIDSLVARPLTGTDGAYFPFWSPDGRFIAYFAQDKLLKIPAGGGPPQTLCAAVSPRGGTWGREGSIVFGMDVGLLRVAAAGGEPAPVTKLEKGQSLHRFPSFLPDGRHVLYYVGSPSEDVAGVYVTSLATGQSTRLTSAESSAVYDPQNRRLLFGRQGTLLAQIFDVGALTLAGEPVPVAERLESSVVLAIPAFSVSENGVLAYGVGSGVSRFQVVWVDRDGKVGGAVGPEGSYRGIDLSPDGTRLATHRHDGAGGDIWVTEMSRGTTSRFTIDASQDNSSPIWSPDGSRIAFGSFRGGKWGLYEKPSNGAGMETRLVEFDTAPAAPMGWSPDGRAVVYWLNDSKNGQDLGLLPLVSERPAGSTSQTPAQSASSAVSLVSTRFLESHGQVSPDGRWLAYSSNETGQPEVYVQPFPTGSGKRQVSTAGGWFPRWRGDGRELFYMNQVSLGKLIAVDVKASGATFEAGAPKALFDSGYVNLGHTGNYHTYAISRDGQRFFIPRPAGGDALQASSPIVVVLNWAQAVGSGQ